MLHLPFGGRLSFLCQHCNRCPKGNRIDENCLEASLANKTKGGAEIISNNKRKVDCVLRNLRLGVDDRCWCTPIITSRQYVYIVSQSYNVICLFWTSSYLELVILLKHLLFIVIPCYTPSIQTTPNITHDIIMKTACESSLVIFTKYKDPRKHTFVCIATCKHSQISSGSYFPHIQK